MAQIHNKPPGQHKHAIMRHTSAVLECLLVACCLEASLLALHAGTAVPQIPAGVLDPLILRTQSRTAR